MTTNPAALDWLRIAPANSAVDFRDGQWEAIDQLVNQRGRVLGRTPIASGAGGCLNRTFYGERVIYSPIKAPPCKKRA